MKTKPKRRMGLLREASYKLASSTGQLRFGRWRSGQVMPNRFQEAKKRACRKGNYDQ